MYAVIDSAMRDITVTSTAIFPVREKRCLNGVVEKVCIYWTPRLLVRTNLVSIKP